MKDTSVTYPWPGKKMTGGPPPGWLSDSTTINKKDTKMATTKKITKKKPVVKKISKAVRIQTRISGLRAGIAKREAKIKKLEAKLKALKSK